jgi:hypothetical protein
LKDAIARFGANAKAKLANPGATGEPEDQLRAPLEVLFADLAEVCGFQRKWLAAVGESSLSRLKTRLLISLVICDEVVYNPSRAAHRHVAALDAADLRRKPLPCRRL